MKRINHLILLGLTGTLLVACGGNKDKKTDAKTDTKIDSPAFVPAKEAMPPLQTDTYQKESTDETTAAKLKTFLQKEFKKDLPALTPADRKFSFYAIDLNDDTENEYFVSLQGTYFCGSGGCTFLLLTNDLKTINRFTVMRGPVFRSSVSTNGWHDLIVLGEQADGKTTYRHLKWDKTKKRYPSNPSMVTASDVAPAGQDFTMWDDEFSRAKEFEF